MSDKSHLRMRCWTAVQDAGAARFPGARGRIPNFKGAERAADLLAETMYWKRARVLKCNPDSPQRPVRRRALEEGKRVYMAVPRLGDICPFIELDPAALDPGDLWKASSIKGAFELGRPVLLAEMPQIDMIVTGCVGVTEDGDRLGKGGGYSDLEYGLLREFGLVSDATPIATTVHESQVLQAGEVPMTEHDISLDLVATPDFVIETRRTRPRPVGVLWDHLSEEKIRSIPVLEAKARSDQSSGR